jgi:phosphate transport system permease protein
VGLPRELSVTAGGVGGHLPGHRGQPVHARAHRGDRAADRGGRRDLPRGIRHPQPLARIIEINISNLAAVPSIIYGLLGLGLFVRTFGMGRSLIAGACTLALLVLPVVILSTREALRAVPKSLREGSYALGATQWQTIWHQVLPVAVPGILTGLILALSRAIGETAPLITIGALTYVPFLPDSIWSPFTVLPIQIFNWVSRPQADFVHNAAAGIVVLLVLLLSMNALAIWLRDRYQKRRVL